MTVKEKCYIFLFMRTDAEANVFIETELPDTNNFSINPDLFCTFHLKQGGCVSCFR